jgi:hypothetical protein
MGRNHVLLLLKIEATLPDEELMKQSESILKSILNFNVLLSFWVSKLVKWSIVGSGSYSCVQ